MPICGKLQNNKKEQMERLEAGLKALPTSPGLLQMLCDQQLEDRDAKSARVTLQKLAATKYPSILKEFREAQLLMLEGNFLEASRRLEKLRPQFSKAGEGVAANYVVQADYLLMQCYQQLGLHDLTLATARRFAAESHSLGSRIGNRRRIDGAGQNRRGKNAIRKTPELFLQHERNRPPVPQICNALVQLQISEQMRLPEDSRDWNQVSAYIADLRETRFGERAYRQPDASRHIGP